MIFWGAWPPNLYDRLPLDTLMHVHYCLKSIGVGILVHTTGGILRDEDSKL